MGLYTKVVKEAWLDALKSGEYHQIQHGYTENAKTGEAGHCCLAVFDKVVGDLVKQEKAGYCGWDNLPFDAGTIVNLNDDEGKGEFIPDYSNVIPFIESFEAYDG